MLSLWGKCDKRKKALEWKCWGSLSYLCDRRMWAFGLAPSHSGAHFCPGEVRGLEEIPEFPLVSNNQSQWFKMSESPVSLTKDADEQVNEMNIQDLLPEVPWIELNNRSYYFKRGNFPTFGQVIKIRIALKSDWRPHSSQTGKTSLTWKVIRAYFPCSAL